VDDEGVMRDDVIVLGSKRAGSSLLYSLLSETTSKSVMYEPFNSYYDEIREARINEVGYQTISPMTNRFNDPVGYMEFLFSIPRLKGHKSFCSKIQVEHVFDETLRLLIDEGDYHFIQLVRYNLLELYTSLKRAEATMQWALTSEEERKEVEIELDIPGAVEWMEMLYNKHLWISRKLVDKGNAHAIEYASIREKAHRFEKFGLKMQKTHLKKQATDYSFVKNEEVVNAELGDRFGVLGEGADRVPKIWNENECLRELLI
jgi:hypothetical protein